MGSGASGRGGAQHSQSLEVWLTHIPGLKVVMPSSASDAAGLLLSAIADPNPVVFVENKALYFQKEAVPTMPEPIPIGRALTRRSGNDITIIATSRMVGESLQAAERLDMARRYLGTEGGDAFITANPGADGGDIAIRMTPEHWLTADFSKSYT